MNGETSEAAKQKTRRRLAFWIIIASILGIAVVAGLAIVFSGAEERAETTRLVFTSMLPLFGTWVGTVLAFYFSRESLEAATQSTIDTLRLSGTLNDRSPVSQVMVPASNMTAITLGAGETAESISLHDVFSQMRSSGRRRIPILDTSSKALYLVHDSTINQFASSLGKNPADKGAFTETMGDLLADADLRSLVEAFGFVSQDAVVADARAAMRAIDGANDVFVTVTGQKSEPVIGWVTNTDLAESDS